MRPAILAKVVSGTCVEFDAIKYGKFMGTVSTADCARKLVVLFSAHFLVGLPASISYERGVWQAAGGPLGAIL
jgi:hypothetical protein